ncbi:MAG TPA: hypothetical protein VGL42_08785 [Opitutaceae bacterium]|jgi:hypothetical protein
MNTHVISREPSPGGAQPTRPELFKLPSRGGDPYFGLSRAWYYKTERSGGLQLVRLRRPGSIRGKVMVPYQQVADLIQKAAAGASAGSAKKWDR